MTSPRLPNALPGATFNIIGSGQLAQALAPLFCDLAGMKAQTVWSRTPEHAAKLAGRVGANTTQILSELPAADFTLIAVRDDALSAVAQALAQQCQPRSGQIVFHCSGSQPASVLTPLAEQGALIASCHPLRSFADPDAARAQFAGTLIAIEGENTACDIMAHCFNLLGGKCQRIQGQDKLLYHAGAVIACNYLNTMVSMALHCMQAAGIDRHTALQGLSPLIQGTVHNIEKDGPANALSGPLARADLQLLAAQATALDSHAPDIAQVYRLLALQTLPLLAERGMAESDRQAIQVLFS